jgi:hypothetical protein
MAAEVTALGLSAASATTWRMGGHLRVTVVVKASFSFALGAEMKRAPPDEIVHAEVHHAKNPARSVRLTSDLAPFLPMADVVLTGHAYAPSGDTEAMRVRFGLFRDEPLFDKSILVRGDRKGDAVTAFSRMPLVYERAFGGVGFADNPLGVGFGSTSDTSPNLVDPEDPGRVACFGPISRSFPRRKQLLGKTPRAQMERPLAEVPDGFDWSYFQAAPSDQRVPYLAGDEWLVLEGLDAASPELETRIPHARAVARAFSSAQVNEGQVLSLVADTLRVDTDASQCSLVWRGSFVVPSEAALAGLRILAGVESMGHPIPWPARPSDLPRAPAAAPSPAPASGSPSPPRHERTITIESEDAPVTQFGARSSPPARSVLPFASGSAASTPPASPSLPARRTPSLGAATIEVQDEMPAPSLPFRSARVATPVPRPPPPPRAIEPDAREPAPAPARARAAERTPQGIELVNETGLAFAAVPWGVHPSRGCITVVAKATCDLVASGEAVPRKAASPLEDERLASAGGTPYPGDRALFKVRADVVAVGHAWAPESSARFMFVDFRFGHEGNSFARRLRISGDRVWEGRGAGQKPSEPEAFGRMPLVYERAFGGPKCPANPAGLGFPDPTRLSRAPARLPNIEDADHLIRMPSQKPPPACPAPVPLAWKERRAALGRRSDRWPCLPEDFDWTRFQVAPAPKQLALLAGDEPFTLTGMNPRVRAIQGTLPLLRPRAFALRSGPPERFEEVPIALDTVVFAPDEMLVHLVFRGVVPVDDERAPKIAALLLLTERSGAEPASLEQARAALRRR